jgi:hypothetical protein
MSLWRRPARAVVANREPPAAEPHGPVEGTEWTQVPAINLGPPVKVVGESYYQPALESVAGGRCSQGPRLRLITATLVRERDNRSDVNAVRVDAGGLTIGHVASEDAVRFHTVIEKINVQGGAATCRANLTGGWRRGSDDAGAVGVEIYTGRRPTAWNGRAAFLPSYPWSERLVIAPSPALTLPAPLRDKAVVTLTDRGARSLAARYGDAHIGQIVNRPDLAEFVARVRTLGLPTTTSVRMESGSMAIYLADVDVIASCIAALPVCDLRMLRRIVRPTGRWICERCGRVWSDPRRPPDRWYDFADEDESSPHICPGCWSYAFTHPY